MFGLLISLLVLAVVAAVVVWLINYIAPPEPIRKLIIVAVVIICLIWFVAIIGGYAPPFVPHGRFQ
jgi:membrane-bound metal-dependent hydrolase YbcI (DUF457 family)